MTCHGLPTKLRRMEYLERFPTTQDKGWVQQLQSTRHLIPPKSTASGELGLITAVVFISVAHLLVGQATGAVSLMGAIAFAGAAIPASILMLFVCGHFFRRLSIAAGFFWLLRQFRPSLCLRTCCRCNALVSPRTPKHCYFDVFCLRICWSRTYSVSPFFGTA